MATIFIAMRRNHLARLRAVRVGTTARHGGLEVFWGPSLEALRHIFGGGQGITSSVTRSGNGARNKSTMARHVARTFFSRNGGWPP